MVGKRRKENVEMANLAKKDANGIRTETELRRLKNATNAVSLFTVSTRVGIFNSGTPVLNISLYFQTRSSFSTKEKTQMCPCCTRSEVTNGENLIPTGPSGHHSNFDNNNKLFLKVVFEN